MKFNQQLKICPQSCAPLIKLVNANLGWPANLPIAPKNCVQPQTS